MGWVGFSSKSVALTLSQTINLRSLRKRASDVRSAPRYIAALRAWNWVGRSSPAVIPKRKNLVWRRAKLAYPQAPKSKMFISHQVSLYFVSLFPGFSARVFLSQFRVFNSNFSSPNLYIGIKWANRKNKKFSTRTLLAMTVSLGWHRYLTVA